MIVWAVYAGWMPQAVASRGHMSQIVQYEDGAKVDHTVRTEGVFKDPALEFELQLCGVFHEYPSRREVNEALPREMRSSSDYDDED